MLIWQSTIILAKLARYSSFILKVFCGFLSALWFTHRVILLAVLGFRIFYVFCGNNNNQQNVRNFLVNKLITLLDKRNSPNMRASQPCDLCGCMEVNLHDGFYYCIECGTQDKNFQETIVEAVDAVIGDGILHGFKRKIKKVVEEEKQSEWTVLGSVV